MCPDEEAKPYCMLHPRPKLDRNKASNAIPEFWLSLSLFCDADQINKWKNTVFSDPRILILVLKDASISSPSRSKHKICGIRGCSHLSRWNFHPIKRRLPFNSSGKFWAITKLIARLIYLRKPHHQKAWISLETDILCCLENDGLTPRICSGEMFTFTTKDPKTYCYQARNS